MRQMMRPRTLNDVFCPGAFKDDFVCQAAAFTQDEKVKRITQMLVIHDRVLGRIRALERHLPARPCPKQRGHHRKCLLPLSRSNPIRFWPVALRIPELDVRLLGSQPHGIAAFSAVGLLP